MLKNIQIRDGYYELIRFLSDNGISIPLISIATAERPWINQGKKQEYPTPYNYLKEDQSVEELFEEIMPYLNKNSQILEIGCNAGRNLNYLYKKGFKNLTGVEIGPLALKLMKIKFPQMYKHSKIILGSAPEVLKGLTTAQYDLVFCHSVLINIHPSKNYIFKEMARISKKFVVTIESEGDYFAFPRDFKKMFEKQGMEMIVYKHFRGSCESLSVPYSYIDKYENNILRIFVHRTK